MSSFLDPFNLASNSLSQSILPGWSLFTVNQTNSTAPETEQRILARDSYGRQIGRMMDVIEVLLKDANRDGLSKDETKAVDNFEALKKRVDQTKLDAQKERQARLVEDLMALKRRDETQFNAVIQAVSL